MGTLHNDSFIIAINICIIFFDGNEEKNNKKIVR